MDKVEYQQKLEELTALVKEKKDAEALAIADSIDWRRVKSVKTLNLVADVYERCGKYEKEKDILTIAHTRTSIGRGVLARLVETCLKLGQVEQAEKYYREFAKVAQNDTSRYVLQYELYKAKNAPLDAQIAVLEEYREREYTERWAYELAELYARAGEKEKCIDACDDLILWFSEGEYVLQAMELKKKFEPLNETQQAIYTRERDAQIERARREAAEKAAREKAEAERIAREKAEAEAAEKAAREKEEAEAAEKAAHEAEETKNAPLPAAEEGPAETPSFPKPTPAEYEVPLEIPAELPETNLPETNLSETELPEAGIPELEIPVEEPGVSTDGATETESVERGVPETDEPGAEAPKEARVRPTGPEDLKNRVLRTLHSVFGGVTRGADEDDFPEDFDDGKEAVSVFADGPDEKDLKVRELLPDDVSFEPVLSDQRSAGDDRDLDPDDVLEVVEISEPEQKTDISDADANAEVISDAVPVEERPQEDPFDLDSFLSETANAFSDELSVGSYKGTTDEEPVRLDEECNTAEEEAAAAMPGPAAQAAQEKMTAAESIQAAIDSAEPAAADTQTAEKVEEKTEDVAEAAEEKAEAAVEEAEEKTEVVAEAAEEKAEAAVEEAEGKTEDVAEAAEEKAEAAVEEAEEKTEAAVEEAEEKAEAAAEATEEKAEAASEEAGESAEAVIEEKKEPEKKKPHYIEELEIPDEDEPTPEERKSHTIPLGTIGQNTVPISLEQILSEETPEEQRIRILNKARPTRMNEEQRKIFTYFARIPGMDSQILEAISGVYRHAGERTSLHGNIGIMGARGTGKSRLSEGLVVTMCRDLDLTAAKVARITGDELNTKDPAKIAAVMNGGFLMIEDISHTTEETLNKLNQAMEFRTDCMVVIIEDEKNDMRAFLKDHPVFAAKFDKLISIPVFTNDELVTFARTYAAENDCQLDDLGILALYTKIGNMQSEEKPVTISEVRDLVDRAIDRASKGRRRNKRGGLLRGDTAKMVILHEKDFD